LQAAKVINYLRGSSTSQRDGGMVRGMFWTVGLAVVGEAEQQQEQLQEDGEVEALRNAIDEQADAAWDSDGGHSPQPALVLTPLDEEEEEEGAGSDGGHSPQPALVLTPSDEAESLFHQDDAAAIRFHLSRCISSVDWALSHVRGTSPAAADLRQMLQQSGSACAEPLAHIDAMFVNEVQEEEALPLTPPQPPAKRAKVVDSTTTTHRRWEEWEEVEVEEEQVPTAVAATNLPTLSVRRRVHGSGSAAWRSAAPKEPAAPPPPRLRKSKAKSMVTLHGSVATEVALRNAGGGGGKGGKDSKKIGKKGGGCKADKWAVRLAMLQDNDQEWLHTEHAHLAAELGLSAQGQVTPGVLGFSVARTNEEVAFCCVADYEKNGLLSHHSAWKSEIDQIYPTGGVQFSPKSDCWGGRSWSYQRFIQESGTTTTTTHQQPNQQQQQQQQQQQHTTSRTKSNNNKGERAQRRLARHGRQGLP